MKRSVNVSSVPFPKAWKRHADHVLRDIQNSSVFLNLSDSSTNLGKSDCIRAFSMIVPDSPVKNLALKCMLDAENKHAGASLAFLLRVSNLDAQVPSYGTKFTVKQLKHNISSFTDKVTADIVVDAALLSGRQGKIVLDPNEFQSTEISYGTQVCKWKPPDDYFHAVKQNKVEVQNCSVVFIDGIIESVAECHRLFNDAYEKSVPVVIFARGFAQEVIATAAVNTQRKTAVVVPIVVPFDEVGVNALGDIASCFNSELISSDKGQLISSVNLNDCAKALRISSSSVSTEIEHRDNYVDNVIRKLLSKLSSADENHAPIVRSRIKALGSGLVTIKVGNDKRSILGIKKDRVDFGLRYTRSCMLSGLTEYCGLFLPFSSVKIGVQSADSFLSIIQNCTTVVEVDKCG